MFSLLFFNLAVPEFDRAGKADTGNDWQTSGRILDDEISRERVSDDMG